MAWCIGCIGCQWMIEKCSVAIIVAVERRMVVNDHFSVSHTKKIEPFLYTSMNKHVATHDCETITLF